MADAVAIASVISSGLVGLAGIGSTVWGQGAARRWQSREERVSELRGVLDSAATGLATAMQSIADANRNLDAARLARPTGATEQFIDECITEAKSHLESAVGAQRDVWVAWNRLRVRKESSVSVAAALNDAQRQVGALHSFVGSKLVRQFRAGYEGEWAKATDAERNFYDAAAAELAAISTHRQSVRST